MATYKRGNIWYIDYYITVDGKRERRREPVGTRKDMAIARHKECRNLVKAGIDPKTRRIPEGEDNVSAMPQDVRVVSAPPSVCNLKEFEPVFLRLHGSTQSRSMQQSYSTSLGHLLPVFGETPLDQITKVAVRSYMTDRLKAGVRNATVNREVTCLKGMLTKAVEWEYIRQNPLQGIKLLKEPSKRVRYLSDDEFKRLLAASPPYLQDMIVFAIGTGMRQSEIFNLKWPDVRFWDDRNTGEISVLGKGDKVRSIRMNETVFSLLKRRLKSRKRSSYVFPSPKTGGRLTDVKTAFRTALKTAKISNFRFHDLRHTAASWMVMEGVGIYSLQEILGHADTKTTQRYAHLAPDYLESEMCKLDQKFRGL